jgi:4-amino-4-deoxy-L-arabinose transferase-like glycosyltransferase
MMNLSQMQEAPQQENGLPGWALILCCVAPFFGFWLTGLFDLDEGFYAAVTSDMLRRGDWITPTYNGIPWFEKPILSYWLAMPTILLFGEDFGPRSASFLCTLATAFVLYRWCLRHFGKEVAQGAALATCGSLLVVGIGRMMMTDGPLVLCQVIAFTTFYDSLVVDRRRRLWTAFALGLAVLAKGPVSLVFFVLIAGFFFWRSPSLRPQFKGYWAAGTIILFATIATWYLPCYLQNGQVFIQKFLIEQNIGRFAGGDKAHQVPFWAHPIYFPLILLLACLPWSSFSLKAWWQDRLTGNTDDPQMQIRRYLWVWALVITIFFTVSQTKLPHYILPAVAPFLILLVVSARQANQVKFRNHLVAACLWCLALWPFCHLVFQQVYESQFREVQELARYARKAGLPLAIYEIGRQEEMEIGLRLQETSHPSVLFYYGGLVKKSDSIAEIAEAKGDVLVLTRTNRLTLDDQVEAVALGKTIDEVETGLKLDRYRLYRLRSLNN